jgi:hypothetical protein
MEFLKESQDSFIQNEIWMLTFGASFQRSGIYNKTAPEAQKGSFKTKTRAYIVDVVLDGYKTGNVSDGQHIENIKSISAYSSNFSEIFVKGKINFGIAQKMLNLYLKYMWSLGNIPEPPHFPVDRIIQIKLIEQAKQLEINPIKIEAWTQFNDEKHYLKVISSARELISKNENLAKHSLAELELLLFDRR